MWPFKRWQLVGVSCGEHLSQYVHIYGTVKVQTLDPELISTDTRCNITNCHGHVGFVVEK